MMDTLAETVEYENGIKGEIHWAGEGFDINPRKDYDHASVMVCAHPGYTLGDVEVSSGGAAISHIVGEDGVGVFCKHCGEELEEEDYGEYGHVDPEDDTLTDRCLNTEGHPGIEWEIRGVEILPLSLYDHSGISMSVGGPRDAWDSSQVGFIYMTDAKIKETYLITEVDDEHREKARELMTNEVREYDDYLTGNVYGYIIYDGDESVDSCWGFLGDPDKSGIKDQMKAQAEYFGTLDAKIKTREDQLTHLRARADKLLVEIEQLEDEIATMQAEKENGK
jgi:hypothetical protein